MELTNLRKLNSKIFDLGSNKRQLLLQQGLHYQGTDDLFQDCDTTLVAEVKEGFDEKCEKIQLPFRISKIDGKRRLYPVVGDKTKYIEFGGFGLPLTSAVKLGNKLTWDRTNFTLEFLAIPEGLKFRAVLKNASAPTFLSFPVSLSGLTFDKNTFEVKDGENVVCVVGKGYATDSSPEPITRTLTTSYSLGIATFSLDTAGMIFPIVIDPQVTKQPSVKDAKIYNNSANQNYGNLNNVNIYIDTGGISRGLFNFNFSEDVPAGSTIDSATLSLYYFLQYSDPSGRTIWAYKLTNNSWIEGDGTDGVTWAEENHINASHPGSCMDWTDGGPYVTSNPAGGSTTWPASYGWMSWVVTAIVQDALDSVSGVANFLLRHATEPEIATYEGRWYSKEYTDTTLRPKLVIDYTAPSATGIMTTNKGFWGP